MADPGQVETRRRLRDRLLISVCVGAIVATISILAGWASFGGYYFSGGQGSLRNQLTYVDQAIQMYQQEHQGLPESVGDLHNSALEYYREQHNGGLADPWGRPLTWKRDGNDIVVGSLGRDGKPGGVGVDYDQSTSELHQPDSERRLLPSGASPTLYQYLFEIPTQSVTGTCLFTGFLAGLLTAFTARKTRVRVRRGMTLPAKIFLTVAGASFIAFFMAYLHIDTGH